MSQVNAQIGETDGPRPVNPLPLEPLNRILFNACLSPKKYDEEKKKGQELRPKPCGSTVAAAYLYQPELEYTAPTPVIDRLDPGASPPAESTPPPRQEDGQENAAPQAVPAKPTAILPGAGSQQVVRYWRDCEKANDLGDHFQPDEIVLRMRPEDLSDGRLGLLERLRLGESTCRLGREQLREGAPLDDSMVQSLKMESERLKTLLTKVRTQLRDNITKLPAAERDPADIRAVLNKRPREGKALDLQAELARLEAVLGAGKKA